jgi:hypothetical protein
VAWPQVPGLVWLLNWRAEASRQAHALHGAVIPDAASLRREPQTVARELVFRPGYLPDREQRYAETQRFISIALTVALIDAGWEKRGDLGDPVTCTREAETIEPFALMAKFQSAELTPEAWRNWCAETWHLGASRCRGRRVLKQYSRRAMPPHPELVSERQGLADSELSTCDTRVLPAGDGLCPSLSPDIGSISQSR